MKKKTILKTIERYITVQEFLAVTFSVYIGISMICFLIGVCEAHDWPYSTCRSPMTKIEYIFPAHAVGCWANEQPIRLQK